MGSVGTAAAGGLLFGLLQKEAQKVVEHLRDEVKKRGRASVEHALEVFTREVFDANTQDIGDLLLSEGLASLYVKGGAKYDGRKEELCEIEEEAKSHQLGIWALPDEAREHPSEYKQRERDLKKNKKRGRRRRRRL